MFQGFVELGQNLDLSVLARNSSGTPVNTDALPAYRVYGPEGPVPDQAGSAGKKDSGAVTGATNATPIVISSSSHGLTTGTRVTLSGVGGNTAANGTFVVTYVDADHFSLDGSAGNGAYTSGGSWWVTGLYEASLTCSAANGYESGQTYTVLFSAAVSGAGWGELVTFVVG